MEQIFNSEMEGVAEMVNSEMEDVAEMEIVGTGGSEIPNDDVNVAVAAATGDAGDSNPFHHFTYLFPSEFSQDAWTGAVKIGGMEIEPDGTQQNYFFSQESDGELNFAIGENSGIVTNECLTPIPVVASLLVPEYQSLCQERTPVLSPNEALEDLTMLNGDDGEPPLYFDLGSQHISDIRSSVCNKIQRPSVDQSFHAAKESTKFDTVFKIPVARKKPMDEMSPRLELLFATKIKEGTDNDMKYVEQSKTTSLDYGTLPIYRSNEKPRQYTGKQSSRGPTNDSPTKSRSSSYLPNNGPGGPGKSNNRPSQLQDPSPQSRTKSVKEMSAMSDHELLDYKDQLLEERLFLKSASDVLLKRQAVLIAENSRLIDVAREEGLEEFLRDYEDGVFPD